MFHCLILVNKGGNSIQIIKQIITKKLRKKCHHVASYRHSNDMQSLLVTVFSRSILPNRCKIYCNKFLRDGTTKVGPGTPKYSSETRDPG